MNQRKIGCILALALPLSAARLGRAGDGGGSDADVLSPAIRQAVKGLSADDYAAREKALQDLQLDLARQLQTLLSTDDPESRSRLAALLEFNDGLNRWALEALKLPEEQRKAQLKWGLAPKVLPAIAKVYSSSIDQRVAGVKQLAGMDEPEVSFVLARLLDDPERAVYIAAMEAVWDRKPTDAIVSALWNRAVEAGFAIYNPQPLPAAGGLNIAFRGKIIGGVVYENAMYRRMQDNQIATDVLVNLKAPQVIPKLRGFFEKAEQAFTNGEPNGRLWMYMAQSEPMKNAYRLVEEYKPRDLVPVVYKLATSRATTKSQGQIGAEKYYWSNRTAALAAIVTMTGQNPEEYKLKKMAQLGAMWCVPAETDEDAAVAKLTDWWHKNAANYGIKLDAAPDEAGPAASQPAAQPQAGKDQPVPPPAAPAVVPVPRGVHILNLQIQGGGQVQIQGGNVQIETKGQ